MATVIGIMGESGSGKTSSLRNLDPMATYIVDCDKKGLSWLGWRKQYSRDKRNYRCTDDVAEVEQVLHAVNKNEQISVVVVDTINGLMVADEYRRRADKGYDKWADLAWSVYGLFDMALTLRDSLTVVFVAHTQTDSDDFGNRFTHIKTNGRKLDKIVLESKLPINLWAKVVDGQHVFDIGNEFATAKVPFGMYTDDVKTIPNDIAIFLDKLWEAEKED